MNSKIKNLINNPPDKEQIKKRLSEIWTHFAIAIYCFLLREN